MTGKTPLVMLNNGIKMPLLGLGVFQSDARETAEAVATAIAEGYRLIDTAEAYHNEDQVGEGIRRSGIPRDEIFVTTKVYFNHYGYDETLRAFEQSTAKLGLDHVDLYLLHWPVPSRFEETIVAWKALEHLLSEQRVRAIGVCNFRAAHLDGLIEVTSIIPALNQVELHPFLVQEDLRAANEKLGVVTQAWSPIGGVNRYRGNGEPQNDPLTHPVIGELASKYQKTSAQIILRWHIERGVSVIPKSVKPSRIRENIDVFEFSLAPGEVAAISALDRNHRGGPDPDRS